MIVDTLQNLEKYIGVNPLFADVVKFIKENDLNTLEEGKHLIKDKDLFVNIQVAKGKTAEEAAFETHRRMLDRYPWTARRPTDTCPSRTCPRLRTTRRRTSRNTRE